MAESIIQKKTNPTACQFSVKTALTEPIADSYARYVLNLKHSALRDDTVKLRITEKGLLSSSNVVADDKTADVLVSLTNSIMGLVGGPVPSSGMMITANNSEEEDARCKDTTPREYMFDPMDYSNPKNLTELHQKKKKLGNSDLFMIFETLGSTTEGSPSSGIQDGLFYRTPAPVKMTIWSCESSPSSCQKNEQLITLPQAGPVSYIPMKSRAFVKTVNDVQFKDGVPTSWDNETPGEALAIAGLPFEILKAAFSAPAEILSLKVDYSSQAESLATQQLALSQQQTELAAISACLQTAATPEEQLTCYQE